MKTVRLGVAVRLDAETTIRENVGILITRTACPGKIGKKRRGRIENDSVVIHI